MDVHQEKRASSCLSVTTTLISNSRSIVLSLTPPFSRFLTLASAKRNKEQVGAYRAVFLRCSNNVVKQNTHTVTRGASQDTRPPTYSRTRIRTSGQDRPFSHERTSLFVSLTSCSSPHLFYYLPISPFLELCYPLPPSSHSLPHTQR